jgi:hypothetical protein
MKSCTFIRLPERYYADRVPRIHNISSFKRTVSRVFQLWFLSPRKHPIITEGASTFCSELAKIFSFEGNFWASMHLSLRAHDHTCICMYQVCMHTCKLVLQKQLWENKHICKKHEKHLRFLSYAPGMRSHDVVPTSSPWGSIAMLWDRLDFNWCNDLDSANCYTNCLLGEEFNPAYAIQTYVHLQYSKMKQKLIPCKASNFENLSEI